MSRDLGSWENVPEARNIAAAQACADDTRTVGELWMLARPWAMWARPLFVSSVFYVNVNGLLFKDFDGCRR